MIYLECKPDEALVGALGVPKREREHSHDKGRVCNKLKKSENAIGMVDEDPGSAQPGYFSNLELVSEEYNIRVHRDNQNNRLIILCPNLEGWVLKAANDAGVSMSAFSLPDDPKKLHGMINSKLKEFSRLVEDLKDKSDSVKALQQLLLQN